MMRLLLLLLLLPPVLVGTAAALEDVDSNGATARLTLLLKPEAVLPVNSKIDSLP